MAAVSGALQTAVHESPKIARAPFLNDEYFGAQLSDLIAQPQELDNVPVMQLAENRNLQPARQEDEKEPSENAPQSVGM